MRSSTGRACPLTVIFVFPEWKSTNPESYASVCLKVVGRVSGRQPASSRIPTGTAKRAVGFLNVAALPTCFFGTPRERRQDSPFWSSTRSSPLNHEVTLANHTYYIRHIAIGPATPSICSAPTCPLVNQNKCASDRPLHLSLFFSGSPPKARSGEKYVNASPSSLCGELSIC